MKKIIFLIPTLSSGGGERVVSELSRAFAGRFEVKIALFKKEISYPYGGEALSLGMTFPRYALLKMIQLFRGLLAFRRLVKQEHPDYVVSFGHHANLMNILSGARRRIVRADNYFSSALNGFGGAMHKIFIKRLFNKADVVIAVSKEAARDLKEHFAVTGDKIKVVYNPLNIKEIEQRLGEPLEPDQEAIFKHPTVINMGRLNAQKGQWHLIKSVKLAKETIPKLKLVLLGQGELELALRAFAKNLGLEKDVHFLSWQKNPFAFLSRAKVFALSSLWEGLPYVVLEAMACGLPIVSVDCKSGPREILAPFSNVRKQANAVEYTEYGVLVPPENPKDLVIDPHVTTDGEKMLAEAICRVILDQTMAAKLRVKSLQRVQDFNIKHVMRQWNFLDGI